MLVYFFNRFGFIMNEIKKDTWKSQSGYIWSLIGSAVGFGNILGFSAKAYFHGGGAFLIPFSIALIVLGIPLLFLEGIVGQQYNMPLVSAAGKAMGKIGKFWGWLSIIAVTTIGGYYVLLTGWTVAYSYFSASDMIPHDSAAFLKEFFLKDSGSITTFSGFSIPMLICTLLVGIFSWWVVSRNIQSGIEKLCSIFLPMLTIMVFAFAIIVSFMPGAWVGFKYYLIPDFSKLWNARLWLESFGHVFFSLSLGIGIITGYSRHADKKIDIKKSMVLVAIADTLISIIAGFAIFGCVGYMSHVSGIAFADIVKSESSFEMGFVVFPTILKTFGSIFYRIVGPLFFFCVFIAGVTGVFSIIEAIAGNIEVEFKHTRKKAVTIASLIMLSLAVFFCMGNGQHIIGALEPMVTGFNMLIGGIAEIIIFMFCSNFIKNNAIWFSGKNRSWSFYLLRYFDVALLGIIFLVSLYQEIISGFGIEACIRWGWLIFAIIISMYLSFKNAEN